MPLESYMLDLIAGKRTSPVMQWFMKQSSGLYRAGVQLRHRAYDWAWKRSYRAPLLIVSVGNIAAGGVGKTPLTCLLAQELRRHARVAILTRGARSSAEKNRTPVRVAAGMEAALCGDEPVWLAARLPDVAVWVGRNRCLSAEKAFLEGCAIAILDDGMQYRQLQRDVEVAVVDGKDPLERGRLLPYGLLRDVPERLAGVDCLVVNYAEGEEQLENVRQLLAPYTSSPIVGVHPRLEASLKGRTVGLFCGLGRPQRFIDMVRQQGASVVDVLLLPDHRTPAPEVLELFAKQCKRKGAEALVCTEKDAVKLPGTHKVKLPVEPLAASLEVVCGKEAWNRFLQTLIGKLHARRI
jgi:tetraacyldisaccharide 4'-kinase